MVEWCQKIPTGNRILNVHKWSGYFFPHGFPTNLQLFLAFVPVLLFFQFLPGPWSLQLTKKALLEANLQKENQKNVQTLSGGNPEILVQKSRETNHRLDVLYGCFQK